MTHENLILKFDKEYKVFICRPVQTANYETSSVDVYFPIIYYDAKSGKHYEQVIPQSRLKLSIHPGYGTTYVSFYDLLDDRLLFKKTEISRLDNKHEVASFIEDALNERLAEQEEMITESEIIALIAQLQKNNNKLYEEKTEIAKELNLKTKKLKQIAELINE